MFGLLEKVVNWLSHKVDEMESLLGKVTLVACISPVSYSTSVAKHTVNSDLFSFVTCDSCLGTCTQREIHH